MRNSCNCHQLFFEQDHSFPPPASPKRIEVRCIWGHAEGGGDRPPIFLAISYLILYRVQNIPHLYAADDLTFSATFFASIPKPATGLEIVASVTSRISGAILPMLRKRRLTNVSLSFSFLASS